MEVTDKNGWIISEDVFKTEFNHTNESIFSLGNGYLGMRGNFEEGYSGETTEGTYINGFYEIENIHYDEACYGFPNKSQTMLNIVNSKYIKLYINEEEFDLDRGELIEYKRSLDCREGILNRELKWKSPKGKIINLNIQRIVSFNNKNLAVIQYSVTPINFSGIVKIVSAMDWRANNASAGNDPRIGSSIKGSPFIVENKVFDKNSYGILMKTKKSNFLLGSAIMNDIVTDCTYDRYKIEEDMLLGESFQINAFEGREIKLNKYIAYVDSKSDEQKDVIERAIDVSIKGREKGFEQLKNEQVMFLREFWNNSDIEINGDVDLQKAIRFNMFQLLQSTGVDGKTNISAKGLTGEGYGGHYFWDTEMYILPFYLYTNPEISRKLLEYRFNILDKARQRAREMSHEKGALFPWRTIDGGECSSYFLAGTAQYHINADIAYAVKKYMETTGDIEYLIRYGAETLFETARIWADIGFFNSAKENKFCINGVTGPDEYTAMVDNNFYTNLMARENLKYAYEVAILIKDKYREEYSRIMEKIELDECEIEVWKNAADRMYIPYSKEKDIFMQDDSFLAKEVWDFENTPKEKYPLLLNYHPLVIYRYQVCKQADTILGLFLLGNMFDKEQKRKNYDYYESITTHDSSLSECIFSIVANEIGYKEKAYSYFAKTAGMDLYNYKGNTKHGLHTASMAGSWMCMVHGFGGMRINNGQLEFSPYIPNEWNNYSFRVKINNALIMVRVYKDKVEYELLKGKEIAIQHFDKKLTLELGVTLAV